MRETIVASKIMNVICWYARADYVLMKQLDKHLTTLKRERKISVWKYEDDNSVATPKKELALRLTNAKLVLLLVSSDFLSSGFYSSQEMKDTLRRRQRAEVHVI